MTLILCGCQDAGNSSQNYLESRYFRLKVKTLIAALEEAEPTANDVLLEAPSSSTHHGKIGNPTADSENLILEVIQMTRTLQDNKFSSSAEEAAKRLDNFSVILHDLGMHKEACEMSATSVKLYNSLVPNLQSHDLATALHNYFNHLNHVGNRTNEALKASLNAEGMFRDLVNQGQEIFNIDLALTLNNTADCLRRLGRHEESSKKTKEAVDTHRCIAYRCSDIVNPHHAMSLRHLSHQFLDVGRRDDALKAAKLAHPLPSISGRICIRVCIGIGYFRYLFGGTSTLQRGRSTL